MNEDSKNFRVVLYDAPVIWKNDTVSAQIQNYVLWDKQKIIHFMKRNRVFLIENLNETEAEECAHVFSNLGVQVDMEPMGLDAAHKEWLIIEGKKWVKRGLIFPATLNRILQHYGIEEKIELALGPQKEKDPKALINTVLYIGATLIGLGIILFIAANWEKIPPSFKIMGATLLTISFLHTGYNFKFGSTQKSNLAHALFFLASLGIGATILLIGQIYHVEVGAYTLPLIWGALLLPIAIFMQVHPILFITGGLWLLSHFYYHDSYNAFFWFYPILLLGILLPYSIKLKRENLFHLNLGCLMLSCFMATLVSAHLANLLYASSLFILYYRNRKELYQVLALVALALWNISFLALFETFPNILYLIPLAYFFWSAYKKTSQKFMILNLLNTLFWLFIFFYQIQQRFNLPSPEATDICLFLLALSLFFYSLGKQIQKEKNWQQVSHFLNGGGLILGIFMISVLSFRFYTNQGRLVESPLYFGAIVLVLAAGLVFLIPKLILEIQEDSRRWGETSGFILVGISIITSLIVPPDQFWHVLIFNLILFMTAFVLMLKGYREKILAIYNGGVALFIIYIVTRYFDTLWMLIPRSLFFILGGIFLMLWAFFIDKKRRAIVQLLKEPQV